MRITLAMDGKRLAAAAAWLVFGILGFAACDDDCDPRDPYCRCDPADPLCRDGVGPSGYSVGGPCVSHGDCYERCESDDHYEGMCTMKCDHDGHCPAGSACVKDAGGICAATCSSHADCDPFGAPWACQDRDRKGDPGKVGVCRIP